MTADFVTSSTSSATSDERRCPAPGCRQAIPVATNRYGGKTGRPARFCSDECRKRAHAAKRAAERARAEQEARVARAEEERQERARLAADLVALVRARPGAAAQAVAEWMGRDEWGYGRGQRQAQVAALVRFVARSTSIAGDDEKGRPAR